MGRRKYSSEFKAKVALEALRNDRSANEIASEYGLHANQLSQWKKQAQEELARVFDRGKQSTKEEEEKLKEKLYSQIGQLKVELDWLKKKVGVAS